MRFNNLFSSSISEALSSPFVTNPATARKGFDFFNPSPPTKKAAAVVAIAIVEPVEVARIGSVARVAAAESVIATFFTAPVATTNR